MRVNGRILRPSTLAERRILSALGIGSLRVPRTENPYRVAKMVERLAKGRSQEMLFLRSLVSRSKQSMGAERAVAS